MSRFQACSCAKMGTRVATLATLSASGSKLHQLAARDASEGATQATR